MFIGDYHTHTKYSDGHSSVLDVITSAREKGLKEVAITDHGFFNIYHNFALTREKYEVEKDEVKKVREKNPDINILLGVEADIVDSMGNIDMTEDDLMNIDILTVGFHRFIKSTNVKDFFRFVIFNGFFVDIFGSTKNIEKLTTDSYIEMLHKYPVDILAHVNNHANVDVYEVCKACEEIGTLVEINMKHLKLVDSLMPTMLKTNCNFIVNSDSHKKEDVGEFLKAEELIKKYDIPESRIVNMNKMPTFTRLNEYKNARK